MAPLDSIFAKDQKAYQHPLLRFLDSSKPDRVRLEVIRPKDVLGYKSAAMYLHWAANGVDQPPQSYPWDADLNSALVQRRIVSLSPEAEAVRFSLALRDDLKRPEARFGEGYFNAVLILVIRELGFQEYPDVGGVLKHVAQSKPHMDGGGYGDCRDMIVSVIVKHGTELVHLLDYSENKAKEILAGAMARYLDERFTVTDRIRLGWITS